MMKYLTINEVMPQLKEGEGIFYNFENPVWASLFTASELDIYFAANYGERIISPYLNLFLDESTDEIEDSDVAIISHFIYKMFSKQWAHVYQDLTATYNPIENTNVTEEESITRDQDTTSSNEAESSSDSSGSGTNASNVYGFDSATAVGDTTGSDSTSAEASASSSNSGSGTLDETITRSTTKHGNIGVTTNVAMLSEDIDFWQWNFIDQICRDIVKIIGLGVY